MSFVQKVKDTLQLIEQKNADLNIMLYVNPDAEQHAKAIEEKIASGKAGKLAGKIIAIKSCICVEGMPTTCASKTLEDWKATYDADVIKQIKAEDGLIIGMVNMDEFASGASGETSAFGPTKNPAALDRVPGGSSSGSAAAVAAGFCDLALGTDTGGSIRNPASHCGVIGVKPSYGRVSRYGLIDLSMSLDQIGPVGTNMKDVATLMEVLAQTTDSEADGTLLDEPMPSISVEDDVTPLSIGVNDHLFSMCTDERIAPEIQKKIAQYTAKFNTKTTHVPLKHIELGVQTYYPLVYVEFFSGTRKFDGRKYAKKIEDTCGPEVLRRILGGQIISHSEHDSKYYKRALAAKKLIAKELQDAFEHCDVIVLPTVPRLPHKLGEDIDLDSMYSYDAFTTPANLAGVCAGVIPCTTIDGVPVGLQIYAAAGREDILFKAMQQFSSLT